MTKEKLTGTKTMSIMMKKKKSGAKKKRNNGAKKKKRKKRTGAKRKKKGKKNVKNRKRKKKMASLMMKATGGNTIQVARSGGITMDTIGTQTMKQKKKKNTRKPKSGNGALHVKPKTRLFNLQTC